MKYINCQQNIRQNDLRILFSLVCIIFVSSCTKIVRQDIGIIFLHDEYFKLNEGIVTDIDKLITLSSNYHELEINTHICLDTSILIQTIEGINALKKVTINLNTYGSYNDNSCRKTINGVTNQ